MAIAPKANWPWVRALLHSVYDQPDAASVHTQFDRVLDALIEKLPRVAEHLEAARADVAADLKQQPQRTAQLRDPPPHRQGRYLGLDVLSRARLTAVPTTPSRHHAQVRRLAAHLLVPARTLGVLEPA